MAERWKATEMRHGEFSIVLEVETGDLWAVVCEPDCMTRLSKGDARKSIRAFLGSKFPVTEALGGEEGFLG